MRLCDAAVFKLSVRVLVGGDVFGILSGDVIDQNRLAVIDAPDGELVLFVGAPRVRCVALSVFDRKAVLDEVLLRSIEADAENAGINDLVDALIEFEQNRIEIERGCNLPADFAQQLDTVLLRCDLHGLRSDLLSALVDGGFQRSCLLFEDPGFAACLLALVITDPSPCGVRYKQEKQNIDDVGESCPVPRRKNDEGV